MHTAPSALQGRGCPGGSRKTGLDPTCPGAMFLESPAISPAKTEASRPHPSRPYRRGHTPSYPTEAREAKMRGATPVLRTPVGKGPERRRNLPEGAQPAEHSTGGEARSASRGSGRGPGRPHCSEDGSPEPDGGRRKQRLRREQAHGQGARPGWGRHGQWPQPPPVYSAGKREAPHPKAVVKAGAQNEALGWDRPTAGAGRKTSPEALPLASPPRPPGRGEYPTPAGRGGSAQTAVVSAPQAGRGWASTCPHPRPCRNEPGLSGLSLQGGHSAARPALPGPQTLHLSCELVPRRAPGPQRASPKGPRASQPDL